MIAIYSLILSIAQSQSMSYHFPSLLGRVVEEHQQVLDSPLLL